MTFCITERQVVVKSGERMREDEERRTGNESCREEVEMIEEEEEEVEKLFEVSHRFTV